MLAETKTILYNMPLMGEIITASGNVPEFEIKPGLGNEELQTSEVAPERSLSDARQGLVTLFHNRAAAIERKERALDAQPFDFTTGKFKPEAREAYFTGINNLITSLIGQKESSGTAARGAYKDLQEVFEDAEGNLDWLFTRQNMIQRSKLFGLEDRWRDDPKISPHLSGDFFL